MLPLSEAHYMGRTRYAGRGKAQLRTSGSGPVWSAIVAHALVRSHSCVPCFTLVGTQSRIRRNHVQGVHTSVNAARVGACATMESAN